jgi:hypothetical protein
MKVAATAVLAWAAICFPVILSTDCRAQNDERDAAIQAYQDCLHRAAAQRDDQKSDAGTIAAAMVAMCAQEYAAEKAVWGKTASDPAEARILFERMDAMQLRQAVELVLKERQDRARPN